MRFLLIFIIFIHALFITACHGFLDPETTTINVVLPKAVRNFVKINLDRTETVNEKNYNDGTTTKRQEISKDSTSNEQIDTTSELSTTRHSFTTDRNIPKKPEVETPNRSVLWFFGGALAGVILSFIVFYIYIFFKSRTGPIYQNL